MQASWWRSVVTTSLQCVPQNVINVVYMSLTGDMQIKLSLVRNMVLFLSDCTKNADSESDSNFVVNCPPKCKNVTNALWGYGPYSSDSSICLAAIHAGVISSKWFCVMEIFLYLTLT